MRTTIHTAPLQNLWLTHTDDIPLVLIGHIPHIGDRGETLTVQFDADQTGFCWGGTDSTISTWVWPVEGTATTTVQAVLEETESGNGPVLSGRALLATCAALDALALGWRLRQPAAVAGGPQPTSLRILPLDSSQVLWLVESLDGYARVAFKDPSTGTLRVSIDAEETVAAALKRPYGRDVIVAQSLTNDTHASSEAVEAAGWLSPAHASLAMLHTRTQHPLRYRELLSSDPVSHNILGEAFLSLLEA